MTGRAVRSGLRDAAQRPLVLLGATVLSGCVAWWCAQGDLTARVGAQLLVYGVAFAAYLATLHGARGLSRPGLLALLMPALLWRIALVAAPPLLSDDVNRYVWEGRIQVHGGNPYLWDDRPEAERWSGLRDAVWAGVTHREYTALYPPGWQLAAWAVVRVSDSVTAMKAFVVACELLGLWLLAGLLHRRGQPPERLLVQAWSPLVLVEVAGSGHNEPLGMLGLVAALFALQAGHPLLSALSAAAGFQAKLLPGLIAAAWLRRYRPAHLLAAAAAAVAVGWPYFDAGAWLWHSLGKYGRYWRFNDALFGPLQALAGSHEGGVRLGAGLVTLLALALGIRRAEPVGAALAVVAAWLLLAPNVLPWYALWLVPLLVLRDGPGALLFTGTVSLAYLVYPAWRSGEPWRLAWEVRVMEYAPCLALAAGSALLRRPAGGWRAWTETCSSSS